MTEPIRAMTIIAVQWLQSHQHEIATSPPHPPIDFPTKMWEPHPRTMSTESGPAQDLLPNTTAIQSSD